MGEKENNIIDCLKGIAFFFVVLGHGTTLFITKYNIDSLTIRIFHNFLYCFHVPLFFMIAGYLCHQQPIKAYLVKKYKRIIIPYYFFGLLKLLYSWFISSEFSHGRGIEQLIDYFFIGNLYWFIFALFIIYILAVFIWKMKPVVLWILLVGIILSNVLYSFGIIQYPIYYFQLDKVMIFFPFFLLGYILRIIKSEKVLHIHTLKTYQILIILISCISFNFVYIILTDIKGYYFGYIGIFFRAISMIIIIYFCFEKISIGRRQLSVMAKYSLQIMLLDSFFKVVLFSYISKLVSITPGIVVIISIVNIMLGILVCKIVEKIPVINKCFGL